MLKQMQYLLKGIFCIVSCTDSYTRGVKKHPAYNLVLLLWSSDSSAVLVVRIAGYHTLQIVT